MKNRLFLIGLLSFIFPACTENEKKTALQGIEMSETEVYIEVGEELQLSVFPQPAKATLPTCLYFSEDVKIAAVSETGLLKGISAGSTVVGAKTPDGEYYAECDVTVTSSAFFREPYLKFGCTVTDIKKYETREIETEDSEKLIYSGENADVNIVLYDLEYGKMDYVGVAFNKTSGIEERVADFLSENYDYLGEKEGDFYYISSDGKTVVILVELSTGNLSYLYVPYEPSSSPLRSFSPKKEYVKEALSKLNSLKQ